MTAQIHPQLLLDTQHNVLKCFSDDHMQTYQETACSSRKSDSSLHHILKGRQHQQRLSKHQCFLQRKHSRWTPRIVYPQNAIAHIFDKQSQVQKQTLSLHSVTKPKILEGGINPQTGRQNRRYQKRGSTRSTMCPSHTKPLAADNSISQKRRSSVHLHLQVCWWKHINLCQKGDTTVALSN